MKNTKLEKLQKEYNKMYLTVKMKRLSSFTDTRRIRRCEVDETWRVY